MRDGHIGTISTVEALGKETTESVGNISRGAGFYAVVNDGVRKRRLTGTGFAVAPKTLAGRFIIKKTGEEILFGELELITELRKCLYLLYNSGFWDFFHFLNMKCFFLQRRRRSSLSHGGSLALHLTFFWGTHCFITCIRWEWKESQAQLMFSRSLTRYSASKVFATCQSALLYSQMDRLIATGLGMRKFM